MFEIDQNQKNIIKIDKTRESSSTSGVANKNSLDFLSESLCSHVSSIEQNIKKAILSQKACNFLFVCKTCFL